MMKKTLSRCCITVLIVLTMTTVAATKIAHADFINVLSREYSIWGHGVGYWYEDEVMNYETLVDYSLTSNDPLYSYNHEVFYGDGAVSIKTKSEGGITSEYAWVSAVNEYFDIGNALADGYASAAITFQPLVDTLVLTVGPLGMVSSAEIYDKTAGQSLQMWTMLSDDLQTVTMSLNLDHTYTIKALADSAGTVGYIDGYASLHIAPSMGGHPVPEPATILLLFAGLLGLAGVSVRNQHKLSQTRRK